METIISIIIVFGIDKHFYILFKLHQSSKHFSMFIINFNAQTEKLPKNMLSMDTKPQS